MLDLHLNLIKLFHADSFGLIVSFLMDAISRSVPLVFNQGVSRVPANVNNNAGINHFFLSIFR